MSSGTTSQQPGASWNNSLDREKAIISGLVELSACWERPIPPETQAVYIKHLRDLEPNRIALAFDRAAKECEFWPVPAVLRRLANVGTPDQCSESEGLNALRWVIWRIRRHGIEGRPAQGRMIQEPTRENQLGVYEVHQCPPAPEPIRSALEDLGAGSVEAGVRLIAQHPLLGRDPDEYPTPGLRLSAQEKLEARWLASWRRANP